MSANISVLKSSMKGSSKDKGSGATTSQHALTFSKGAPGQGPGSGAQGGFGPGYGKGSGKGSVSGSGAGAGIGAGAGVGLSGLASDGQGLEDHWLVVDTPCQRCVGVTPVVWSGSLGKDKDKRKGAPKGTSSSSSALSFSSGLHYQVHIRVSGKVFELGVFQSEEEVRISIKHLPPNY